MRLHFVRIVAINFARYSILDSMWRSVGLDNLLISTIESHTEDQQLFIIVERESPQLIEQPAKN